MLVEMLLDSEVVLVGLVWIFDDVCVGLMVMLLCWFDVVVNV